MNLLDYIQTRATNVQRIHDVKGFGVEFDTSFGRVRMIIQREEFEGMNFFATTSVKGVEDTLEGYRLKYITNQSLSQLMVDTKAQHDWVTA